MRLRRRIERLEAWWTKLREDVDQLRAQVSCGHEDVEFEHDWWFGYRKICADCDLVLETYSTREDWLKAKAKWMRAEAARLEKEAKEADETI